MANSKSALKRVRQNNKRNAINTALRSRVKSLRKRAVEAAEKGDKEASVKAYQQFTSTVDKCLKKNVFHKNKAANLKSKTAKAVKVAAA